MSRSDSIRAMGLQHYLEIHAGLHHGKSYHDLLEMIRYKGSINYMARAFGVSKNTMQKWVKIYHEEQKNLVAKV